MKTDIITATGTASSTEMTLPASIFEVEAESHTLINQTLRTFLSNSRTNNSTTKIRGEVRGGGRKPWKQKGTGRARVGSIRSPLWRGGGITFGPSGNQNFTKKVNKKMKQLALKQALSIKATDKQVRGIELPKTATAKTKDIAKAISGLDRARKVVVLVDTLSPELIKASKNINGLSVKQASYLNINDVVNSDYLLLTDTGLKSLEVTLTDHKTPKKTKVAK